MSRRWAVVGVPDRVADGGALRASHIFRDLALRTRALAFYRPGWHFALEAVRHPMSLLPGVNIAAAELLPSSVLPVARRLTNLCVMDLHDHPVLQAEAVGLPLSGRRRGELDRLTSDNIEAFERVIVVSSTFGDLAGVPAAKRLVIPNGTDTTAVRPGQWPARHRVGFVSGAAPGRGIELLIDAMNILRLEHSATLALGLVATSTETGSYLAHLKRSHAHQDWIAIHTVPYRELGSFLADCSVLVIPHPAGAYMDSALPVKLFDSMAAGRPLVVTPRTETVRVVTQAGAGVACESDSAESLAAALSECLTDIPRSQEMGRRGRQAAEQLYDWRILSAKVADEFLSG